MTEPVRQHVFVTGSYRSGTTLVDKLLHAHPAVAVASQPFPYLYLEAKRRFLSSIGYVDRYPFGDRFLERRYTDRDLHNFLGRDCFSPTEVQALISAMHTYSGFLERRLAAYAKQLGGGTMVQVQAQVHEVLARVMNRPDALVVGSKEVLTEELVPHLLDHELKVILVVRDPRSVLTSLSFGRGSDYGGETRPVLFHVRNWRKGAAYALALRQHASVTVLRFEDVLASPNDAMGPVWRLLGLEQPLARIDTLVDQRDLPWSPNTSFPSVPSRPDRWRQILNLSTVRYVESCTYPELIALGYQPIETDGFDADSLRSFDEPVPIDRPEFPDGWGSSINRVDEEAARVAMLPRDLAPSEARIWFIQPGAHEALRRAMRGRPRGGF
jgi:Sulfotransferase family